MFLGRNERWGVITLTPFNLYVFSLTQRNSTTHSSNSDSTSRTFPQFIQISVDLFLTNGKRMVKALPMALPGASQGCRTLGYDRGGDKAPQTRSNGCREIVFGHDAPLWSEPFNRSRTVMAAVRVAHPPAPRRHPRELSYHPQHP